MKVRLPLFLGLSALSACAGIPDPPPGQALASWADRHVINVEQSAARVSLAVAPDDTALSGKARDELSAFAGAYLRYGHGAMILSAPAGSGNERAAAALATQARSALLEAGISYGAVAASSYDASGQTDAPILVSFARFEARAPECAPLWEQDLAHQSNNQPWESFGCATQANLAALVEDPRDLVTPRGEDPRDSGRRTTVFDAYRRGESTHALRSDDEHIAVSDAVN